MQSFDVLHSLHCVVRAITSLLFILKLQNADPEEQNMVRKGLDGDYYYPEKDLYEHHSRNHLGTSAIPFPHLLNVPRLLFCHAYRSLPGPPPPVHHVPRRPHASDDGILATDRRLVRA